MATQYSIEAINSLTDIEKLRLALAYLHHNDQKNVRYLNLSSSLSWPA